MRRHSERDILRRTVARLNGAELPERLPYYESLVREGLGGFIVFGGGYNAVRNAIAHLQSMAEAPLIISSDLERGLGQQIAGGTHMPAAMGMAEAFKNGPDAVRRAFRLTGDEAASAGINVIYAPVLDIDSNPDNPIIATRAFGGDAETVTRLGLEMMRGFNGAGVTACGKHWPGHGDTAVDSHIGLPMLGKSIIELSALELAPFRAAITAGIPMLMLAHMTVPALDPAGLPVSCSARAVRYLREEMGYGGILTTDAMDMGALKCIGEAEAARLALNAGVEIILHPSDPMALAGALSTAGIDADMFARGSERLMNFRHGLISAPLGGAITSDESLSEELARLALRGRIEARITGAVYLVVLSDDPGADVSALTGALGIPSTIVTSAPIPAMPEGSAIILTVFSQVRAWKGGSAGWLREAVREYGRRAALVISFGSPHLIDESSAPMSAPRLCAFSGSTYAQRAVAEVINDRLA